MNDAVNSVCVICGNSFAARKGKLYCSETCKQKAYYMKKKVEIESKNDKPKEIESINYVYKFDLSIWRDVKKIIPDLSIEEYCFITRGLKDVNSVKTIVDFINDVIMLGGKTSFDFFDELNDERSQRNKMFNEFKELFSGGKIMFWDSKPEPEVNDESENSLNDLENKEEIL